jgi:hypothetical protein
MDLGQKFELVTSLRLGASRGGCSSPACGPAALDVVPHASHLAITPGLCRFAT